MNKTSKIKEVNEVKEWGEGERLTYYHNLTLENGDKINIGFKDKKSVGTELPYEMVEEVGQHEFTKAKTPQKEFTAKGGYIPPDQDAILYQVILKGVMSFYTEHTDLTHKDNPFNSKDINELTLEIAKGAKESIKALKLT